MIVKSSQVQTRPRQLNYFNSGIHPSFIGFLGSRSTGKNLLINSLLGRLDSETNKTIKITELSDLRTPSLPVQLLF